MSRIVRAKLVRTSACECGALSVNEDVPLGKEYRAFPDTMRKRHWQCVPCGRDHHSNVVLVDDGVKPIGWLFADLFEFDEGEYQP